ncbi:MAG: redoxin domain-containing protein [Eubacteriales bacterium]
MKLIEVGALAPDFTLEDTQEQNVRLSDLRGKKVLLSWHPLAWTGVCLDQMRSLEVNLEKFESLNTVPFGLSVDSGASKKAWAAVTSLKNIRLLCDFWPHGKVAQEYGIFIDEFGISERANIIIDENGIVKWVKVYPIAQLPDINEVLQVLSEI